MYSLQEEFQPHKFELKTEENINVKAKMNGAKQTSMRKLQLKEGRERLKCWKKVTSSSSTKEESLRRMG